MPAESKYFNPVPLFILFRETIEAAIVVSVLLTFLSRTAPQLKKQVWWGVAAGVLISLILAAVFAIAYYKAQNNLFQGRNQMIFNGVIFWVASAFVTFLGFAMLRYKGWEDKWARKLKAQGIKEIAATEADSADITGAAIAENGQKTLQPASSLQVDTASPLTNPVHDPWWRRAKAWISVTSGTYSMFLVVFFTVLREGLESVVFLFGVGNTNPLAIPISGLIGIFCGLCVGVVLYYSGKQVKDIKWLLYAFATVLFFIAAGACENGANLLMNGGMFGRMIFPATPFVEPGAGAISSKLYGVEGAPPAPSAANLLAAGFNDGDEGPMVAVNTVNDGYYYVMSERQPWYMASLWDISKVAGDRDEENKFLALAASIFGYNSQPTFISVVFYLGYWLITLSIGLYKWNQGTLLDADWKHNRAMKIANEEARIKTAALHGSDGFDSNSNSSGQVDQSLDVKKP